MFNEEEVQRGEELPEVSRMREAYIPALMASMGKKITTVGGNVLGKKLKGFSSAVAPLVGLGGGSYLANESYTPDQQAKMMGASIKGTPQEMAFQANTMPELLSIDQTGEARKKKFLEEMQKLESGFQGDMSGIRKSINDTVAQLPEHAKKFKELYE